MNKLLVCIVCGLVLAVGVLQLRQQNRELAYECGKLHSEIKTLQVTLWNQQLQIATATAPNAIDSTVGMHNLELVPANSPTPESGPEENSDEQ